MAYTIENMESNKFMPGKQNTLQLFRNVRKVTENKRAIQPWGEVLNKLTTACVQPRYWHAGYTKLKFNDFDNNFVQTSCYGLIWLP